MDKLTESSFVKIFSKHHHSQNVQTRGLKFGEKVHLPTCHVSCVTRPVSHIIFFFFFCFVFFFSFYDNVVKLVGEGSVINKATPSSLNKYCNVKWGSDLWVDFSIGVSRHLVYSIFFSLFFLSQSLSCDGFAWQLV